MQSYQYTESRAVMQLTAVVVKQGAGDLAKSKCGLPKSWKLYGSTAGTAWENAYSFSQARHQPILPTNLRPVQHPWKQPDHPLLPP